MGYVKSGEKGRTSKRTKSSSSKEEYQPVTIGDDDDPSFVEEGAGDDYRDGNGAEEWKKKDFAKLELKPDHANRPSWPFADGKIFLETFSPLYKTAYDFLIAIAEPHCSKAMGEVIGGHNEFLNESELAAAVEEKETHSFEIDLSQVENVKQRCLPNALNYPMLEEYDFRNDTVNPDLEVELKPHAHPVPIKKKALVKCLATGKF